MSKLLIVGTGIKGAASAALLRQHMPPNKSVFMWDKARGPGGGNYIHYFVPTGGRMSTKRCAENPAITADLGAQYITLSKEYSSKRQSLYSELQSQGILKPMQGKVEGPNNFDLPGAQHFVTPDGSSSLVKYFLQKSGAYIKYQHQVSEISFENGSPVSVTTHEDITEDFDIVVLTLPVPQMLQLRGSLHDYVGNHPDVKKKLLDVTYSSRYALALFFPPQTDLKYPWCVKYVSDNPCVRYIAIDQARRGEVSPSQGLSLVVHTSVPYGLAHLEDDLNSVRDEILSHLSGILPELPTPLSVVPHRWRYSQVHQAYEGTPGCVVLSRDPLIILAGDAFSKSTFDGCIDSAEAVLKAVMNQLGSS
ncbi:unnamed protein product [Candidula unifasciata]|uniref:Amine oxidase domain-containing protein n=1 Tax=Candidula unifasciata TaxID=100452 RepID=A0A8S4A5H4_9EUPU|nr:unnamed protein product [Candidula unifasciata]